MADRTKVFRGADNQWYWHRQAPNNRIVATGGEGFTTKSHAERAAKRAYPPPPFPWPYVIAAFILGLLIGLTFYATADDSQSRPVATTVPAPAATTTAPTGGSTNTVSRPVATTVPVLGSEPDPPTTEPITPATPTSVRLTG